MSPNRVNGRGDLRVLRQRKMTRNFYSLFVKYYTKIFPFSQQTYAFLKEFTRGGEKNLLDAGCGTGDYADRFHKDGFQAAGFDSNEEMIEYARARFPETEFLRLDLLELPVLKENFDLIYSIGNTVSHLTQAEFVTFAGDVYQQLNPGGHWIFQVKNWDHILQQTPEYTFPLIEAEEGKVKFFRQYTDISTRNVTFINRLEDQGDVVFDGEVKLFPIQNQDYLSIHHRIGFILAGHFADFNMNDYEESRDSANIFVFSKPAR
jgi:SAM-dependent methyltransferase